MKNFQNILTISERFTDPQEPENDPVRDALLAQFDDIKQINDRLERQLCDVLPKQRDRIEGMMLQNRAALEDVRQQLSRRGYLS